jgi:hypothetical protein
MNSRGLPTTRGQTVGEGRAFELGGAVVLGGAASVLPTSGGPNASISALLARKCGYASRGRVSEINFHHSARRLLFERVRVLTKGLSVLETQSILKRANYFLPPPFFLNPLGAISSSSDASSSRNLQSDPRECRAMQSNAEESRAIQEIAGTHSEKQNNPRDCRAAQTHPGDFQENTGSGVAARHSFGRHQNCTRHLLSLIA